MAGPGGREVGRVSVRVAPDFSGFANDVKAELRKIESGLQKIEVEFGLDRTGLTRDIRSAVREAEVSAGSIHISTEVDTAPLERVAPAMVAVNKSVANNRGLSTRAKLFTGLGVAALFATPGVLSLAGGLTSVAGAGILLPGIFTGVAAGIGTLVVGFQGMGDAFKNMGDPEKFAESLKALSPAAAATALAFKGLSTEAHNLRLAVQEKLFSGLAAEITSIGGTYLPIISAGFQGIATQANGAATAFAAFLKSPQTVTDTTTFLDNIGSAFGRLVIAVEPFMGAMRDIGTVGSSFLPALSSSLAGAALKFGDFISNARESGKLGEWIQSGIDAFGNLASGIGSVARIFGGFIAAAGAAGGGTLSGLADVLGRVATVVNGPAFQKGLTSFFTGLQGGLTAAMAGLPALGAALAAAGPAVGSLATLLGSGLGAALVALSPLVISLAPAIQAVSDAMTALLAVIPVPLLTAFAAVVGTVAGGLKLWALGTAVVTAATSLMTAAQGALNLVMSLNPFAKVVLVLTLLAGAIALAWQKSETFRNVVEGAWNGIKRVVNVAWENVIRPALEALARIFTKVGDAAKWLWQEAIKPAFDKVGEIAKWLWQEAIKPAFDKIKEGIGALRDKFDGLLGFFRDLPNKIGGFFSGLADTIQAPFKAAFNGIARLWNNTVGKISFSIPSWVPGVGGNSFDVPDIPEFAKGGYIPATPGGQIIRVAEAGQGEFVHTEDQMAGLLGASNAALVQEVRALRADIRDLPRAYQLGMRANYGRA